MSRKNMFLSHAIILAFISLSCSAEEAPKASITSAPAQIEQNIPAEQNYPPPTLDEGAYGQVFAALLQSADHWSDVPPGDQIRAVENVIQLFRMKENTAILKSAPFYTAQINNAQKAGTLSMQLPLPTIVKFLSVMEYDFYNGQDKNELAKEVLGDELFLKLKEIRSREGAQI